MHESLCHSGVLLPPPYVIKICGSRCRFRVLTPPVEGGPPGGYARRGFIWYLQPFRPKKTKRTLIYECATNATQQFNNITSQHLYHLYKLSEL